MMDTTHRTPHPIRIAVIVFVVILGSVLAAWYVRSRSATVDCGTPDYWSTCIETRGNPTIDDLSSPEGELGAKNMIVEISGTHFGPGVKVWFGDKPAEITKVYNSWRLRAVVPVVDVPQAVDVSVARGNGPKSILHNAYRHEEELEVDSISPKKGPAAGGTKVTIRGEGFAPDTRVDFGGQISQNAEYIDQHTLRVVTPPHEPGKVVVNLYTGEDNLVLDDGFTYE